MQNYFYRSPNNNKLNIIILLQIISKILQVLQIELKVIKIMYKPF